MVEKLSFAGAIPVLYAADRVAPVWLGFAALDVTWLARFLFAFLRTPRESRANRCFAVDFAFPGR